MPAVAITDHGGCSARSSFTRRQEGGDQADHRLRGVCGAGFAHGKSPRTRRRNPHFHLTLLAADEQGYHNLVKLVSIAHLDGMYYKPRIDKELLAQHSRGADRAERLPEGRGAAGDSSQDDLRRRAELAGDSTATSSARRISSSRCTTTASRRSSRCNRVLPQHRARISGSGWSRRTTCISSNAAASRSARRADLHRHRRERRRRAADALRRRRSISSRRRKCARSSRDYPGGVRQHARHRGAVRASSSIRRRSIRTTRRRRARRRTSICARSPRQGLRKRYGARRRLRGRCSERYRAARSACSRSRAS